ncbi:transmembrane and TPR repeat-containing protein CG31690 isoform X1 [Drosophila persimilis]|uniref:transmembrane and TPR repeat-containing protein CG31690 isoform X1 n=2 Tax=Drosophila persimilis TaxID=7234 RepID=UPI000F08B9D4|nr:transmembrane and TPR repeat-containing protein CG31690 isoform X1 [Drosophila persimilis]
MLPILMAGQDFAGLAGCSALAFVLYLNTFNAGFVYDDRRAILANGDVTGARTLAGIWKNDYWGTPLADSGSHGSWRPLCVLSFRLNFLAGGLAATGYHVINVLLHCLATWLLVLVGRTLLPTRAGVLAAGALFAAHPAHTEAVAGLVGRADLAACVCYLLTYLTYQRHMRSREWSSLALTLLLALAALLCKETAITAVLLCGLCDVLRGLEQSDKYRLRSLCILSVFLFCALYCRLSLLPRPATPFAAADNPTAHEACWWTRTLTFLYLPAANFRLLLWPQVLSFDWGMEAVPRIRTLWEARNLLSAGFYGSLLAVAWRGARLRSCSPVDYAAVASISLPLLRRIGSNSCHTWLGLACNCHHQLKEEPRSVERQHSTGGTASSGSSSSVPLMGVAFLVLPFLPASNLLFHVGFVLAERVLYLPSVGYCLLFGYGFGKLWQRSKGSRMLLLCCLGVLLGAFSLRTVRRNLDWRDEEQLYRSAIPVNPPKALANLGSVLSAHGRYEEAKVALTAAIAHRPHMADAHFNLGVVHQKQLNFSSAVSSYRRAIGLRPQLAVAFLNLGTSLLSLDSQHGEADSVFRSGARLQGHGVRDRVAHEEARYACYLQLGSLYRSRNRLQEAAAVLTEALEALFRPRQEQRATLHFRLGEIYAEMQQWEEAERQQRLAMQLQPQHGAAYVTFGQTLARNSSRHAEAELWFKRALQTAPLEPSSHHYYADFLEQQDRYQEALGLRLRAAALAPKDYALHSAVADALRLLNRLVEAELWYRKAVALQPLAAHAHANLGAILQMRGIRQEAVDSYRRALQLQPGHATSRANLARMKAALDTNT